MDYSLNTFLQVYDSIKDSIEKEDNKMPGTMNLIEIMNRHHLENAHSDVIAFLINPDENHKHPEYVNSFIKFVNNKLKEKNQNEIQYNLDEIKFVHREEYTYNKRRIDILIKTETAFIIIENKIGASDQPEQMIDYINDISGRNDEGDKEREIFCIYLTRFEKKISDDSLKEDEKKYIKSFLNLTYSDILDWINTLKTREDETVLNAALIQYKDVLEGLTKQRLTFDRKFNIIKKIIEYVYQQPQDIKLGNLLKLLVECRNNKNLDLTDKRILVEAALPMAIYIKFVLDVKNRLFNSEDIQKRNLIEHNLDYHNFNLFCCNTYFESEKEWLECVMHKQKDFGISWQSPNPDVERYFMFADAGHSSAFNGYFFKNEVPHKSFMYYNPKTDKGNRTVEPVKFVNDALLKNDYSDKILNAIVENNFIKLIKEMDNKWFE